MDYARRRVIVPTRLNGVGKKVIFFQYEETAMKRAPRFPKPTTNVSPTDYLRNFWCRHYGHCMQEATDRHSYLSCSLCGYKTNHYYNGTIDSPLPAHHLPRF